MVNCFAKRIRRSLAAWLDQSFVPVQLMRIEYPDPEDFNDKQAPLAQW